jgi:hypothetical protein
MRKGHWIFILTLWCAPLGAQIGGSGVYAVLKQPVSAREAAWGGFCNAYIHGDLSLAAHNPALLNKNLHNRMALNFNSQLKGAWTGNASYARNMGNGTGAVHVSFIDYGLMDAYDAGGNPEGQIPANETAVTAGFGKDLGNRVSVGVNAKFVYSILGSYISTGAALDAGAVWTHPDSTLTAALMVRNLGLQLMAYVPGSREPLPFSAELGVNFKPRHMPFRFNLVAHNLQKPDMTYAQFLKSNSVDITGQLSEPQKATIGDKVMRHLTIGTELVLGKNFGILVGYNHQRRKEMAPDVRPGVSGYSWGLSFKISKIQITYASMAYFPGFNANLFTFSSSLNDFRVKKKP